MAPVTVAQKIFAGIFVLLAIAVWVFMSITIEGKPGGLKYYTFIKEPVKGLAPSSVVHYNGIPVGKVTKITNDFRNNQVRVDFLITKPDIEIFDDLKTNEGIKPGTRAMLVRSWVTGIQHIDMTGGFFGYPALREQSLIPSQPAFLTQVTENSNKILTNIEELTSPQKLHNIHNILANLEKISAHTDERIFGEHGILTKIEAILKNIENTSAHADKHVGKILQNVADATDPDKTGWQQWMQNTKKKSEKLLDSLDQLISNVNKLVKSPEGGQDLATTIKQVNHILTQNSKDIPQTLANLRRLSELANEQLLILAKDAHSAMQNFDYFLRKELPQTNRELQKSLQELAALIKILKAKPNALLWGSQVKGQ